MWRGGSTASITERQEKVGCCALLLAICAISFGTTWMQAQAIPAAKNAAKALSTQTQQPATTSPPPIPPDPLGRSSPHGCVVGFLLAAQKNDYARASQYLDVKKPPEEAEELAR